METLHRRLGQARGAGSWVDGRLRRVWRRSV